MDNTGPAGLDNITHGIEAVVLVNKPTMLLDLPTEMLDRIMFHLSKRAEARNGGDVTVGVSTADIKNVRLSCQVLSEAASRYLIDRLRVDVSLSSLSRLEEISQHPLISHSVQVVELCLAQYDSIFDDGVRGFMRFITDHQQEIAFRLRSSPEMVRKAQDISDCWDTYWRVLQSGADTFLGDFDEEIESIQDFAWDIRHTGALLEGFHQYRSRLHEQTSLQQDGFVARVSAAVAKLTGAKHLKITDWDSTTWGRQPGQLGLSFHSIDISSNSSMVNSLAGSRRPFQYVKGNSLLSMIPDLICAAKNIKSLDIQISPRAMSYPELTLSTSQEAELRSGLKKLQSFKFDNYRYPVVDPWNEMNTIHPLGKFLDACLISDDLESLVINAKDRYPQTTRSLFTTRDWPKLKSVELRALPVSAADLDVLTKSLASHSAQGSLALRSVHLYCGATWASILDMLRDRRIVVSLGKYQYGAEFEQDPTLCAVVFFENVWSFAISFPSFANYYVQGEDMPNPLLEPPDQELRDRLFGPVLDYWVHVGIGFDFEGFV